MDELERGREEVLVMGCRLGEPEAYRELVRTMEGRLFYYVRRFVEDDETALEILQEVWIAVFRQIRRLREPSRFRPWIYGIAHHKAVSRFRRERSEPAAAAEALEEETAGAAEPDWEALDASRVHAALDRLSPAHREVLVLFFVEGLSYEEITQATGASLGLVKSRMHYAKKALKAELERTGGGTP